MQYHKSFYWTLALLPITVFAFYPSYFGRLGEASAAHHWHGITSTLWILLLASQAWLIKVKNRQAHKAMGRVLFVLVPLMVGAFAMVSHAGALKAAANHPFYEMFGTPLLTVDIALLFITPLMVMMALIYRRSMQLHAGWMLATLIGLLPPVLSRLFSAIMPGLMIRGPETLYLFEYSLAFSIVISVILCLILYLRNKEYGSPWLYAGALTIAYYLAYWTIGHTEVWKGIVVMMAKLPTSGVFIFGAVVGLICCVIGWRCLKVQSKAIEL